MVLFFGEAMRLVANALNELERGVGFWESEELIGDFSAFLLDGDHKPVGFFGDADNGIGPLPDFQCRADLPLSPVDHHEVWCVPLWVVLPTLKRFLEHRVVIGGLESPNIKEAVLRFIRLAVDKRHHRNGRARALNVAHVVALNAS